MSGLYTLARRARTSSSSACTSRLGMDRGLRWRGVGPEEAVSGADMGLVYTLATTASLLVSLSRVRNGNGDCIDPRWEGGCI